MKFTFFYYSTILSRSEFFSRNIHVSFEGELKISLMVDPRVAIPEPSEHNPLYLRAMFRNTISHCS